MTTIRLTASSANPAAPTLNLMPFHIAHDGPAPLSTYFLVQPAPSTSISTSQPSTSPTSSPNIEQADCSKTEEPKSLKDRLISSFRGRTLRGLKVPLPEGYVGALFRSSVPPPSNPVKSNRTPKRKTRNTRKRATLSEPDDVEAEDEAELEQERAMGMGMMEDDKPSKELRVEGTFGEFVLWNPDMEVVEEEDAYLTGLGEWLRLCALVNAPGPEKGADEAMT